MNWLLCYGVFTLLYRLYNQGACSTLTRTLD